MEPFARFVAMSRMAAGKHILIVDEDREARAALAGHLEHHGFRVTAAASGVAMQRALERARIDLVILDLHPGEDGARVTRSLRAGGDLPFIILARRDDAVDRIVGLEMGADDYLTKPVNPRELLARMRNILRRSGGASAIPAARTRVYRFGGWQLDVVTRELSCPEGRPPAPLRNAEFRVLSSLLAHGNRVVARSKLIELARGRDAGPFDRSIDVRISRLRQILGDDARGPRIIKTVHGEGYVIGVLVERA
ncbi:MAG: two component transcriptional regulator [Steroidobacteraceae bacterium]|jgi:two-component system OmpR family response regulator|nr:two component transcriptional regulator [Steroidobacteraceae bacterium]